MIKRTVKISRGYRLKPSTHKLIKSLAALTNHDADTIISCSCRLFLKTVEQNEMTENKIIINHKENQNAE